MNLDIKTIAANPLPVRTDPIPSAPAAAPAPAAPSDQFTRTTAPEIQQQQVQAQAQPRSAPIATPTPLNAPSTLQASSVPVTLPLLESRGETLDQLGGDPGVRADLEKLVQSVANHQPPPFSSYLLAGNTGTGKETLVRGLAGELYPLGVSTVEADPSVFNSDSSNKLKQAFAEATSLAEKSPAKTSVLFFSNVDGVTPIRSKDSTDAAVASHQELMTFVDQAKAAAANQGVNVVVVGTTSREDSIDYEAQNTFQRRLEVVGPDGPEDREAVLKNLFKQRGLTPEDGVIADIARGTGGKNAADLDKIVALAAQKANGTTISKKIGLDARLEAKFGPTQPVDSPDWMFKLSVSHECGHAVIRHIFNDMAETEGHPDHHLNGIDGISFAPRPGVTASVALTPSGNPASTFEYYFGEIASNYGGREAEYLFGNGHISAGPGNDLKFATALANSGAKELKKAQDLDKDAVETFGMGKTLGPNNPANDDNNPQDAIDAHNDERLISQTAEKVAMTTVRFYQGFISDFANDMLKNKNDPEKLTISGDDFLKQLTAWEHADPQREQALTNLKAWINTQMESIKPQLPQAFDPVTGKMVTVVAGSAGGPSFKPPAA